MKISMLSTVNSHIYQATAQATSDLLKAQAIPSETTAKRYTF